ncbi:MAG TPA: VOC family protein [Candidatus Saccharimonadales bacterium]|nr:VOC family protein [Candidatus Saccharimonadales bacterium]
MKVTSLLFWVQENKTSEKFYRKLGFNVVASDETRSVVSLDGFEIVLVSMRDEEKFVRDSMDTKKGRGMYLYIHVDNADAQYKELVELGLQPATKPKDWEWGSREFILKDPDGYKLCFWHALE